MRVYRVERPESGDGPYNGPYIVEGMGRAHTDNETHPNPHNDAGLAGRDWYGKSCGFDSLDAYRAWFCRWRKRLSAEGYVLSVYEVPRKFVLKGEYQAMFDKRKARLMQRLDTKTLKEVA